VPAPAARRPSLRSIILAITGQDVRRCLRCSLCTAHVGPGEDLSLEGLFLLAAMDDDEALTSRTLWSEVAIEEAAQRCPGPLAVQPILLALRAEAQRRGLAH
jgi:heterodisulfide reductase subunit C